MEPSEIHLEEAKRLLGNCILFRDLKTEERNGIIGRTRTWAVKTGQMIFSFGSPSDNMMAVLTGTVRISVPAPDGKEFLLALLQPGEIFGELGVLDGKERSADAVADSPCTLAILDRRDILSFLEKHPAAWLKLVIVLCERLRRADQLLSEVALLQLPVRLAKAMLRLTASEESISQARTPIIQFSQRELANMVGGTRESVNKCLAAWQRENIVQISAKTILISDRSALEHISELG